VEAIRANLLAQRRLRDTRLVSVLAYAGLPPGEALARRWSDVRERTLVIERALALGELEATKTGETRSYDCSRRSRRTSRSGVSYAGHRNPARSSSRTEQTSSGAASTGATGGS
jgi:integrase